LVIREAAKKGAGIQLQYQGWDQKLAKHNEMSGGKMEEAMQELRTSLGWMGGSSGPPTGQAQVQASEASSIRQQLLSGTYGQSVRVGPW
jgi:protein Cut8